MICETARMIAQLSWPNNQAEGLKHSSRGHRPRYPVRRVFMPCKGIPEFVRRATCNGDRNSSSMSFGPLPFWNISASSLASLPSVKSFVFFAVKNLCFICGKKQPFNPIKSASTRLDQIEPQLRKKIFFYQSNEKAHLASGLCLIITLCCCYVRNHRCPA
jgi:hypothetical protein